MLRFLAQIVLIGLFAFCAVWMLVLATGDVQP